MRLFRRQTPDPIDCSDIYPDHPAQPHWHVGHPRKKVWSFDRPKRSDPYDTPDAPMFVNPNGPHR